LLLMSKVIVCSKLNSNFVRLPKSHSSALECPRTGATTLTMITMSRTTFSLTECCDLAKLNQPNFRAVKGTAL
jgi:hypothetical protein